MSDPTLYKKTVLFAEPTTEVVTKTGLIFIHGGGWVDKRNTANDFETLAKFISNKNSQVGLYSLEYRLSPEVKHPTHALDVLENIARLVQDKELEKVYLLGHSVGATLIWQVLTSNLVQADPMLLSKIDTVFLVDGIYSIMELLDEYPSYIEFVSQAFQDPVTEFEDPKDTAAIFQHDTSIHVIHSLEDELLTLRQTNYFIKKLQLNSISHHVYIDKLGLHNQVYSSQLLAEYVLREISDN